MSENSFKVRAKKDPVKGPEVKGVTDRPQKPAKTSKGTGGAASSTKTARSSGSPTGVKRTSQGQASREKLRRARVTGSASGRMPDRSLPDVPDMGNMRSEERIGKVLGIEKNSRSVNRKDEVPKSDRYSSMKKQIQKNRSTAVKPTPARTKVRAKDDWALFVIRIACALILAILIAIVVLVTTRAVPEASEPPVQAISNRISSPDSNPEAVTVTRSPGSNSPSAGIMMSVTRISFGRSTLRPHPDTKRQINSTAQILRMTKYWFLRFYLRSGRGISGREKVVAVTNIRF